MKSKMNDLVIVVSNNVSNTSSNTLSVLNTSDHMNSELIELEDDSSIDLLKKRKCSK